MEKRDKKFLKKKIIGKMILHGIMIVTSHRTVESGCARSITITRRSRAGHCLRDDPREVVTYGEQLRCHCSQVTCMRSSPMRLLT